jgi:hypothetical protein
VSHCAYHIDHIIPLRHEGSSDLDNLALACFQCNTIKSSEIASYADKVLTPLYNPRLQVWDEHFEMDGTIIKGKTAIGRVTVRTLQIRTFAHRRDFPVEARCIAPLQTPWKRKFCK